MFCKLLSTFFVGITSFVEIWVCLGKGTLYITQVSPPALLYLVSLPSELAGLSSRGLRRPGLICEPACLLSSWALIMSLQSLVSRHLACTGPHWAGWAQPPRRASPQPGRALTAQERRQLWLPAHLRDHQPGTSGPVTIR